jgi:hypothetical protein
MSGLYRWQTGIVGSLKQDVASCTKVQQGIEDVDKQIEIVVKSIRSEQQIATILAAPLKVASVDEANYQTQKDTWHGIIEALGKVDVPSGITPVKIAAVGDASAIESAWSALVTAHTAQNAPDYESACAALTRAYKDMNGVGDESKKVFQHLGDALKQSYNLAFTN